MKRLILILLFVLPLTGESAPPATASRPLNADGSGNVLPAIDLTWSKLETIDLGSNGTATSIGLNLRNDTASTAPITQQNAPVLAFEAHGWFDDGEGETGDDKWRLNLAFRATPNITTTGRLSFEFCENAGSCTEKAHINSNGEIGGSAASFVTASTSGGITSSRDAIGTTVTPGLTLSNSTAAAAGSQQISPSVQWSGHGWKTDVTAGSQAVDFRAYVLPIQDAGDPTGEWRLDGAINSSWNNLFKIGITGDTLIAGTITTVRGISGEHFDMTGTFGNGFAKFPVQLSTPATPASGFSEYANASGLPAWVKSDSSTGTFALLDSNGHVSSTAITARAFNSAAISVANNSLVALTFDSETWDTDSIHSTSSNTGRLKATTAGLYQICATIEFAPNGTGSRLFSFRINGSTRIGDASFAADGNPGATTNCAACTQYLLSANDYVEIMIFQNSGGALNINRNASWSPEFMMTRIP